LSGSRGGTFAVLLDAAATNGQLGDFGQVIVGPPR